VIVLTLPDVVILPVVNDTPRPIIPAFAWTPTVARVLAVLFWIAACLFVAGLVCVGC
jgi:hypothetical protein